MIVLILFLIQTPSIFCACGTQTNPGHHPTQISPMYKSIALEEIIPWVNVHRIFAVRDDLKWLVFVGLIHHLYLDRR